MDERAWATARAAQADVQAGARLSRCEYLGTRRRARSTGTSSAPLIASVADTAIVPLQDVLGLGQRGAHEPARAGPAATGAGAYAPEALTDAVADRLGTLAATYDRA